MSHSTGCKCASCYSLAEYLTDHGGKDVGLAPAPGHARLHVVTSGPPVCHGYANCCACPDCKIRAGEIVKHELRPSVECDGTMTCRCLTCMRDRRYLVSKRKDAARQPWEACAA